MDAVAPVAAPRPLVTGAGGFIGAALLPPLASCFGAVIAGVRRARPAAAPGVTPIPCDLDDSAQLAAALRGVDLVIHAAYGDEAAMPRQAENLLAAMSAAGARNLVAFSSIAVYGGRAGWIDEEAAPAPPLGAYARGKAQCENLYRAWSEAAPDRRALVLRPGIVYGAGSPFWIEKMAERIACGGWGVFGSRGEGRAALIHVDDLARQNLAACRLLAGPGRDALPAFVALNAVGPETPVWNAYFQALAHAMEAPPLRQWSPVETAWRQALAVPAKIARRLHLPLGLCAALAPTGGELALFALDACYSGEKAARVLGYEPRIRVADGLALCGLGQAKQ